MANLEIRQRIFAAGFKYYEVAKEIGITPSMLSVWLRDDLDGERLERVNNAIESLKKKRLSYFASKAE